jgi:hypothetical protein
MEDVRLKNVQSTIVAGCLVGRLGAVASVSASLGDGLLILEATRAGLTASRWTVWQRFVEPTGGESGVLTPEADPDRWLRESIEGNNATWVGVRLFQGPELREAEVVASAPGS